ncbi:cell envelope opacity-associated protein A [Vibrio sp. SS-MA-C1-2]|uniref:LysM-like peptidoglycan-binding domain-containing protein n=1 Tax=Vibrio sp. SS-MA-C1-2 TaxID=2908646 RepID=UPI001F1B11C1|nr:LysM-like peptidoglycan-binding domain-containing protein [Vibrio sp. SS-MA-C1-2]UJF19556.1 cell envelope opacity-associated protein A [Vibrio sp. SS-MA-C1-2]
MLNLKQRLSRLINDKKKRSDLLLNVSHRLQACRALLDHYYHQLPKRHRRGILGLVIVLFIVIIWPQSSLDDKDNLGTSSSTVEKELPISVIGLSEQSATLATGQNSSSYSNREQRQVIDKVVNTDWQSYQIQAGDTLSAVFRKHNLPLPDLYAITAIEGKSKPLSRISPGATLRFKRLPSGEVDVLQIERIKKEPVMYFRLSNGSFSQGK